MRGSRIAAFATVVSVALGAACSLEDGGVVSQEGVADGSTSDGAVLDGATSDGQVGDGSTMTGDSGPPDANPGDGGVVLGDAGPTFLCGTAHVSSCATECPSATHECPISKTCVSSCYGNCAGAGFQCDACGADGGLALSRCEPEDAGAYAECLSGLDRCACPGGNPAACPGINQICEDNACFECQEPDGGSSQVGHTCAKNGFATCAVNGSCN